MRKGMRIAITAVVSVLGAVSLSCLAGVVPASGADATGTTYYVSTRGSDAGSGTSIAGAFRTISRCAQVMQPGDTCLITGGTYRETVTPSRSGGPTAPITYEPYAGQRVVVSGTDPVDGWRQVQPADLPALAQASNDRFLPQSPFAAAVDAGHIYAAQVTLNPDLPGDEVFFDGQRLVPAQWPWPGADPLSPAIEYAQAGTTDTSIADPNLTQPAGYWDGAAVYTQYWFISQTGTVASSAPGSLQLSGLADSGSCVGLLAGNTRYYLFGQLKTLSHAGEWFYDAGGHTLYLWAPNGGSPNGHLVEAKQRTDAFDLSQVSNTHLVGLGISGATVETGDASTGDVLDGVTARDISDYQTLAPDPNAVETDACQILTAGETTSGIILRGHGNMIENSTIDGSAGNGIALLGSDNVVTGDVISNVDAMGTYAAGVNLTGSGQTITHNTIAQTGRSGISIDWHINGYRSQSNRIAYNDISQFNRLSLDSGSMYACCELDMSGTSIDHNWLHSPAPMPAVDPWAEAGLYLDSSSGNALVYDNVGWNDYVNNSGPGSPKDLTPVMIFINGGGNNKLYNNDGPVQGGYNASLPNTVINDIGTVYQPSGVAAEPTINHNLSSSIDPDYVSPASNDYRLRPDSPARNAGMFVPGITVGGTDPQPSLGAYQYGAPFWTAGAS